MNFYHYKLSFEDNNYISQLAMFEAQMHSSIPYQSGQLTDMIIHNYTHGSNIPVYVTCELYGMYNRM